MTTDSDSHISIREKFKPKRKSDPSHSWYDIHTRLDPWSYEKLLIRQKKIGAKSPQAALRYTLRRLRD